MSECHLSPTMTGQPRIEPIPRVGAALYSPLQKGLILGLLLCSGYAFAFENDSAAAKRLVKLQQEIAADYAEVSHISVATLKTDYPDALVVDVRAASEFKRSHLPGALHAPTPAQVDELRRRYPERDLVLYCTVGVRSSIAARDLLAREQARADSKSAERVPGRVMNLAGSIFAWANQGEPLVNASGPTHDVHPFNAWWGFRYLDSKRPLSREAQVLELPVQEVSVED